jgi:hypothetical protein
MEKYIFWKRERKASTKDLNEKKRTRNSKELGLSEKTVGTYKDTSDKNGMQTILGLQFERSE